MNKRGMVIATEIIALCLVAMAFFLFYTLATIQMDQSKPVEPASVEKIDNLQIQHMLHGVLRSPVDNHRLSETYKLVTLGDVIAQYQKEDDAIIKNQSAMLLQQIIESIDKEDAFRYFSHTSFQEKGFLIEPGFILDIVNDDLDLDEELEIKKKSAAKETGICKKRASNQGELSAQVILPSVKGTTTVTLTMYPLVRIDENGCEE